MGAKEGRKIVASIVDDKIRISDYLHRPGSGAKINRIRVKCMYIHTYASLYVQQNVHISLISQRTSLPQ